MSSYRERFTKENLLHYMQSWSKVSEQPTSMAHARLTRDSSHYLVIPPSSLTRPSMGRDLLAGVLDYTRRCDPPPQIPAPSARLKKGGHGLIRNHTLVFTRPAVPQALSCHCPGTVDPFRVQDELQICEDTQPYQTGTYPSEVEWLKGGRVGGCWEGTGTSPRQDGIPMPMIALDEATSGAQLASSMSAAVRRAHAHAPQPLAPG